MKYEMVITLPWPDMVLSPNAKKKHWAKKAAATKDARLVGKGSLRYVELPQGNLRADYMFYPPNNRKRDLDNLLSSMKAYQDGVCDRLEIDDARLRPITIDFGEVRKGGEVVLRLISNA